MSILRACLTCGREFKTHTCYVKKGGGLYCSIKCYQTKRRKNKVIEYDGDTFYLNLDGYYMSAKTRRLYHRLLWQQKYGLIPSGCVIHHKDENRENNNIDNLIMVSASKHAKIHYHYMLDYNRNKPFNSCKIDGCDQKVKGHGLCSKHYQRAVYIKNKGYNIEEATHLLSTKLFNRIPLIENAQKGMA